VNKRYGTQIIISQPTYRYVRNRFILRPLDIVAVSGKLTSTLIYELLGDEESENAAALSDLASGFSRAFEDYLARRWEAALATLEELAQRFPEDIPVALYRERCLTYLRQPPPDDWAGIVRLDSK